MSAMKDLTGMRFGRLLVSGRASARRDGQAYWLCCCECGGTTIAGGKDLRSGHTQSCGCLRIEGQRELRRRHGHAPRKPGGHAVTPTYRSWYGMKSRCLNAKQAAYKNYGGRGITVCERWLSFKNFLADMGPRPSPKHSIDRWPNNDGNYEPSNCRWATATEQARNRARSAPSVRDISSGA